MTTTTPAQPTANAAIIPSLPGSQKSQWWRTVLGEYPTGVTLITSLDEDGRPVGMVVGTFSAVSEEPPMISFMPTARSFTAAKIIANGRFVANVLGSGHETLCREFARGAEDRFDRGVFDTTEHGLPRLRDAVAWFEGSVRDVVPAGDHHIVLADVTALGVGDGSCGLPLIFLKGGYGSFTVPSLQFDLHEFGEQLRLVEAMTPLMEEYAHEADVECILSTVVRDSVVVLAAANLQPNRGLSSMLGMTFPFAAPLSPALATWASDEKLKLWTENARHLIGRVDRPVLEGMRARVRERGYAISLGKTMEEAFDVVVVNPETSRAELAALWTQVHDEYTALAESENWHAEVSSFQVPVFDADGHAVVELVVSGFGPGASSERFEAITRGALATAARLTESIGGRIPED